jgi:hypothetical protein
LPDIAQEVFQILQRITKYNENSPSILNICLFTICILSNREPLFLPTWIIVKDLFGEKPFVFQEVIRILQIPGSLSYWDRTLDQQLNTSSTDPKVLQKLAISLSEALRCEIVHTCFKDEDLDWALLLNDF